MTILGYRIPMAASFLVWVILWEIAGRLEVSFLLPPFTEVLVALVGLVQMPSWQAATVTTLRTFAIGMAAAVALGVPLG
ncbi:MAG: ABC transporter permease, partial [Bauldia sp.]